MERVFEPKGHRVGAGGIVGSACALVLQNRAPFHREVGGVLGSIKQAIDESISLFGIG